jgi:hypothetical protein
MSKRKCNDSPTERITMTASPHNCPLPDLALELKSCPGVIDLRDYVDVKIDAMGATFQTRVEAVDTATRLAIDSVDKATSLAALQLEKRLEGMNEFRNALKDQNATMLSRTEYSSEHRNLSDRISALELSRAELQGKASQMSVNVATILSGLGLLISLVLGLLHVMGKN